MKESIDALKEEISIMKSNLAKMEILLKQMEEGIKGSENKKSLSEVAGKGDVVQLYGELWYIMDIDHGIVKLISKDSAGAMSKYYDESNQGFCRRLHQFSKEYVEEISKGKKLLHTEVRACQKEDLDKYLNRKVVWKESITDKVWYTGYDYWLASPLPDHTDYLWFVSAGGNVGSYDASYTFGVRSVVSLKSDIHTIGKDENGVWILEEE